MDLRTLTRRTRPFFARLWRRFVEVDCLSAAVVLSYATLLAVVPLSAVTLTVLSAFPVFDELATRFQDFVYRSFVPAAGETIQRKVTEFAEQASELSIAGLVFLVATALLLMAQIERVFNRIWRVREARSLASRFLVYWAALTLGPILIGISFAITSYLVSLPLLRGAAAASGNVLLLEPVPFFMAALAFTLAYALVPNRDVPWRSALAGGLVAAVLFELAKRAFAFYVSHFGGYQVLYGALAAVPIFLAWIYLSWVVVLLGATWTASLQGLGERTSEDTDAAAGEEV